LIERVRPARVFLPFPGDRHEDHRQVFDAAMVAMRPNGRGHRVSSICCYETPSETHWTAPGVGPPFEPGVYADIADTLDTKLAAMRCYQSQLAEGIPARSIEAIEAMARFRGSIVGFGAAEAFAMVREIWPAADRSEAFKRVRRRK
jgi:LmbE family N-acetylglucosaminyl deacetylase